MQAEYKDVPFIGPPKGYGNYKTTKMYVAIHDTANTASDTAEAGYAKRRTDSVSSNYYCDKDSLTQSLRTEYVAWHAGSTWGNEKAIAYELTGLNQWTESQWRRNIRWDKLARQVARDCNKWKIPIRTLTVEQMKGRKLKGIVTHNQMRQAWGGTTHTDPGSNFPMKLLIAQAQVYLDGMTGRYGTIGEKYPTLWDMAAGMLGDGNRWPEIWNAPRNKAVRDKRGDVASLMPGDTFWVPAK